MNKALELAEWLEDGQVDSDDNRYLDCAKELRRLVAEVAELASMLNYCHHCHSAPGEGCTGYKHERN